MYAPAFHDGHVSSVVVVVVVAVGRMVVVVVVVVMDSKEMEDVNGFRLVWFWMDWLLLLLLLQYDLMFSWSPGWWQKQLWR